MGFSRGLAAEVGRSGVTANCVALGTMKTGPLDEAMARDPEMEARMTKPYMIGAGRPTRRSGWARHPAVLRPGGVDHRPGVSGRRRLTSPGCRAVFAVGISMKAPE